MSIGSEIDSCYAELIKDNPILSRDGEIDLFKIICKHKNAKKIQLAREKVFNSNLSLVMQYAYRYAKLTSVAVEDLISAGNEGLITAIDKFDYERGNKFSTFAVPWIRLYIFNAMKVMGKIVHIPSHIIEKSREYNEILVVNDKVKISEEDIRDRMDITEKMLRNIKVAQIKSISLDQTYSNSEDGQETLANIIPDPNTVAHASKVLIDEERKQSVMSVLDELTDIQKEVILERYMQENNLKSVGKKLHISGERVRQIEVKALRRIKFKMRQRGYLKLE